jgi:hypothetical protein
MVVLVLSKEREGKFVGIRRVSKSMEGCVRRVDSVRCVRRKEGRRGRARKGPFYMNPRI